MECPVCDIGTVGLELRGVEVDFCPDCRGLWLDAGELATLAGDAPAVESLLGAGSPPEKVRRRRLRCPRCGRRMHAALYGAPPGVVLDRCPHGHGLWFDGGELDALAERGLPGPAGRAVSAFLRDLLGSRV